MTRALIDRSRLAVATIAALSVGACGSGEADPSVPIEVPLAAIDVVSGIEAVTRVVDMQPAPDGLVWILNSQPPYFVVVDGDGDVQREFGDEGGGPQEFDRPVALVRERGTPSVWTYDAVRNALMEVSSADRRTLALPRDSVPLPSLVSFKGAGINPAPPWLESSAGGFLFARARTTYAESALHLWNADVMRASADDGNADIEMVAPLADLLGEPQSQFGSATVLLPYPLWTSCPDGALGLYDPLSNTLRRFTVTGEETTSLELPDPRPVTMTSDAVFEMFYRQFVEDRPGGQLPALEEMRRLTQDQNEEFVRNSSEHFPEYSELQCEPAGVFWLRRFDATTGRLGMGSDWIRITADGATLPVSLPPAFRVFRIEGGQMWGTLRDDLGVESIARIDVSALRQGPDDL